jgi:hypothetical protein
MKAKTLMLGMLPGTIYVVAGAIVLAAILGAAALVSWVKAVDRFQVND